MIFLLLACAPQSAGTCDATDTCSEYSYTSELYRLNTVRSLCTGTWEWDGACATDGSVGSCTFSGDYGTTVTYFLAPAYTPETAEAECGTSTFTPA